MTTTDDSSHTEALERTIDGLADSNGLCVDTHHMHSFRSVQFLLFPRTCAAGCGQNVPTSVVLGTRPVQCIACLAYAHRSCAFSKTIQWSEPCPVNASKYHPRRDLDYSSGGDGSGPPTNEPLAMHSGVNHGEDEKQDCRTSSTTIQKKQPQPHRQPAIFRPNMRDVSLLDTSSPDDEEKDFDEEAPTLRRLYLSASEDGIVEGRKPLSSLPEHESKYCLGRGNANFPFLSAAKLLDDQRVDREATAIQKSISWDEGGSSTNDNHIYIPKPREQKVNPGTLSPLATSPETLDLGTEPDGGYKINLLDDRIRGHDWFKQLSQALHENIIAAFRPIVGKLKVNHSDEDNFESCGCDGAGKESSKESTDQAKPKIVQTADDEAQDERSKASTENDNQPTVSNESIHGLLEETQPKQDSTVARKRLGLASVAGGIAGGVAGLAMAGPVGFIVGIKCGQTAGVLGLLLEGSLTVGALAGGIAAGAKTGQQLQDRLEETRVVALGVGTERKLLLVRPNIQEPAPMWADFYKQARQSYSAGGGGIVQRLLPSEANTAKRKRYEREVDIVHTEEEEIPTSDKVLLLVSRILNNRESLPGHVYRCLVEKFRQRALEIPIQTSEATANEDTTLEDKSSSNEEIVYSKTRRQDAHAVIKYVTATLIEVRPGFASTPSLTELTATAVEGLVFGEVYDFVMEEIEAEYEDRDGDLLEKIANYERRQHDEERTNASLDLVPTVLVSERALEALRYLPQAHSAVDKLRYCVIFLACISDFFTESTKQKRSMGADSLLKMVCQHIILAKLLAINAQIAFLEEFARDEQLLRGMEGYALVTLAASLHFLRTSSDFKKDVFSPDDDE